MGLEGGRVISAVVPTPRKNTTRRVFIVWYIYIYVCMPGYTHQSQQPDIQPSSKAVWLKSD